MSFGTKDSKVAALEEPSLINNTKIKTEKMINFL
jgi:hypothetical protein